MIAPAAGQRIIISSRFEFQVQAISVERLPFILHAAVVFFTTTIAAADDDNFLNDHVRGVIERETRAWAASMAMEEIIRGTNSFFEKIIHQLELNKQPIHIVVEFVVVSVKKEGFPCVVAGGEVRQHAARRADMGQEEVQNNAQVRSNQEGRPSKMGQIMGWASKSLMPQILQVLCCADVTTDGQLKQQVKLLSTYSLKALGFAIPMFYASLNHPYSASAASIVEKTMFVVAIVTDGTLILLLPKWGNALVCVSWLLLELATCLLILSFNNYYAFAIVTALLLVIIVALLQPMLQHVADRHVLPSFTQDMIGGEEEDETSPYLAHLLDLSQGIASFGGLITAIAGHFMVGPDVNAVGFFFFCAIALGLYLSMVVTVGAVSRPHAKCLAIVAMLFVVLTFIAACITVPSGSKPQVVT